MHNRTKTSLDTSPVSSVSTSPVSSFDDSSDNFSELKATIAKLSENITDEEKRELMQKLETSLGGKDEMEKFTKHLIQEEQETDATREGIDQDDEKAKKVPVTKHLRQISHGRTRVRKPTVMKPVQQKMKQISKSETSKSNQTHKTDSKSKNELDRLHEQIKEMYYGNDILNLSGPRASSRPKNFYSDAKPVKEESDNEEPTAKKVKVEKVKLEKNKIPKAKPAKNSKKRILASKVKVAQPISKLVASCLGVIDHFSFSICRIGVSYSCKICSFESTSKNDFMKHIKSTHEKLTWNKFCGICDAHIDGGGVLEDEFKHLLTHKDLDISPQQQKLSDSKAANLKCQKSADQSSTQNETRSHEPPLKLMISNVYSMHPNSWKKPNPDFD